MNKYPHYVEFNRTRNSIKLFGTDNVYQVEDGRLFYLYGNDMFVKWRGETFESNFRELIGNSNPRGMGTGGNAVYFESNKKIYKASVDCPPVDISYVRDVIEGETFHEGALCTRIRNGKEYAYRMSQDPECDGIETDGREVIAVAGDTTFFRSNDTNQYWLRKVKENAYLIQIDGPLNGRCVVYSRSDTPSIIYVTNGEKLALLRDGKMEPLVTLENGHRFHSIVGVYKGQMTMVISEPSFRGKELWTGKLKDVETPQSASEKILDELEDMKKNMSETVDEILKTMDYQREVIEEGLDKMNAAMTKMEMYQERYYDDSDHRREY